MPWCWVVVSFSAYWSLQISIFVTRPHVFTLDVPCIRLVIFTFDFRTVQTAGQYMEHINVNKYDKSYKLLFNCAIYCIVFEICVQVK